MLEKKNDNTDQDEEDQEEQDELDSQLQFPEILPDGTRDVSSFMKRNQGLAPYFVYHSGVLKFINDGKHSIISIEEMIQEAKIGILTALTTFDRTRGTKFSGYAWYSMYGRVMKFIKNNNGQIRLPINMQERLRAYKDKEAEILSTTGQKPSHDEVCKALDIPEKSKSLLAALAVYHGKYVSLNKQAHGGDKTSTNNSELDSLIGNEDLSDDTQTSKPTDLLESRLTLKHLLDKVSLRPRELEIISRRYGLNGHDEETLEEIGITFGITRERVRQIEVAILNKLREGSKRSENHD